MKDDIIRMAREAGIDHWWESGNEHREVLQQHLERFAALVAAAEREACAVLCDQLSDSSRDLRFGAAIRARGQE
jgi:hypothetical protein